MIGDYIKNNVAAIRRADKKKQKPLFYQLNYTPTITWCDGRDSNSLILRFTAVVLDHFAFRHHKLKKPSNIL